MIEEFSLKDRESRASHHLKVHAFLMLERVASSKEFLISVLLEAEGKFIGKTSLGTVTEGQEIWLSLLWDKPQQRFVGSYQAAGSKPIVSFVPFTLPAAADATIPTDFSMLKNFVLNSARNNAALADESKN
jgi:hypothetical protein